jgi:glycine reductase
VRGISAGDQFSVSIQKYEAIKFVREVKTMFLGKKAIVIGERDGVPGPAIAKCLSAAGAEIVYTTTECFV